MTIRRSCLPAQACEPDPSSLVVCGARNPGIGGNSAARNGRVELEIPKFGMSNDLGPRQGWAP
jgi:hypothetical protein